MDSVIGRSLSGVCSAGTCAARTISAEVQALFLMTTVASIEGMKQQVEISGLKREAVSVDKLATMATSSAEHLLKASEVAGGLGAMFATNRAMKYPLDLWDNILLNSSVRPLSKELLSSSAATLVGFVGFEAGAELMHRAVDMIPNAEDRKKASNLVPHLWTSFVTDRKNSTVEDKRIGSIVLGNMYEILVNNSELREKWWSFVMRNRIQTGNFSAGIAMMATGATVGGRVGACVPVPIAKYTTPVIGGLFGVAGGVAATFVPRETKDDITENFQSARMRIATGKILTSQVNVREALRARGREQTLARYLSKGRLAQNVPTAKLDKQIADEMKKMEAAREDLMTSFYDGVHLANSRLYNIRNKIQVARDHQNSEAENRLILEHGSYLETFKESAKDIDRRITAEISFFSDISKMASARGLEGRFSKEVKELNSLKSQNQRFLDQIEATALWNMNPNPRVDQGFMSEQDNQQLLEKIYMWGFKTTPFVETMEFNN